MKKKYIWIFGMLLIQFVQAGWSANNQLDKAKKKQMTAAEKAIMNIEEVCKNHPENKRHTMEEIGYEIEHELEILEKSGTKATDLILENLKDLKKDWKVHYFLVYVLAMTQDEKAIKTLETVISSDAYHVKVRQQVPSALWEYDNELAREILKKTVKNLKIPGQVRGSAMGVIGEMGIDDLEFLKTMLNNPVEGLTDIERIFPSIRALGASKNPQATDMLIELIEKDYQNGSLTRGVAVEALGKRKDGKAFSVLVEILLSDQDIGNRQTAADALAEIGSREAVDPLIKALDAHELVCTWAARALGRLGDKRALPYIKKILDNLNNDERFKNYIDDPSYLGIKKLKKAYEQLSK